MRKIIEFICDWSQTVSLIACVALGLLHTYEARADDWPPPTYEYQHPSLGTFADLASAQAALSALWLDANPGGVICGWTEYAWSTVGVASPIVKVYVMSAGDPSPGGCSGAGTINKRAICVAGATLNRDDAEAPFCFNPTCGTNAGKYFDYTFAVSSCTGAESFCQEGCKAWRSRGTCDSTTLADGTTTIYTSTGTARIANQPCDSGAATGHRNTAFRSGLQNTSETQGSGSTGVEGGPGQADSQTANIARIATNTDRIARTIADGVIGGGSSGVVTAPTVVAAIDAGKTATTGKLEEMLGGEGVATEAGAQGTAIGTAIGAKQALAESALAAQAAGITLGSAPTFGGEGSRYGWALDPFVGASSDCTHTFPVTLTGLATVTGLTLNICVFAPYFRGFMYWALVIWTAYALFATLYDRNNRQGQ